MNTESENWNLTGRLAALSGIVLGAAILIAPLPGANESRSASGKLEGSWFTQVAIVNCRQTSIVLRTFPALNTFAENGTLIDTTSGFSPALRSPGHGTWEPTPGRRSYNAKSWAFLFDAQGAWRGTQKLTHTIVVNGDQSEFVSTNEFFDTQGNSIATGCATAIGQRL